MGDCVLFVGLGNPGTQYKNNRHNVGFMIIDALAEVGASSSFKKAASLAETASFSAENKKIILVKPLTYMNLSGRAVRFLLDFYKVKSDDVFVFHDDIDLEFGRIKIKKGGGNGGHNGLRNIDEQIGCEYWRIRVGIGRPQRKSEVTSYVLHDFEDNEAVTISQIARKIAENSALLLSDPKKLEQELKAK